MKTIGAFEAKTRFSELLREVEKGETFEIRRRGASVATLSRAPGGADEAGVREALRYFRDRRQRARADADEIAAWKVEGRR